MLLQEQVVVVINADDYYKDHSKLSIEERAKMNYDHPRSIDNDPLVRQIKELVLGKPINMPRYDYITHSRKKETTLVDSHQIVVLDLTLAVKEVRQLYEY
ncbi:MAG: Uridine kinase [Candidatus Midichloria mitochondrii]|uniref:Putative uridine kinase n=1 Tax=Midichloria mitochondrii (strain IricVA) TaxID=696127 RepID=F7XU04_MIDMI|nr:putative uridine kinase [Candidatus Midichloria mitochondrii]AEI89363.1 putative uridine kinase [Candidatus Midichloria mitochondrii IricVA]MDJ1256916.1 hypothetical protein [Candidatus Midichloria mitochondrii]MDJ1288659.1 hypothetical protein [Candidatus Midichloria mitochondrii]MDJ1313586.1 hypothetical protein [Candidatus Midichloria mitochondrii]